MDRTEPLLPPEIWGCDYISPQALILTQRERIRELEATVFTLDASGNITGQQAGSPFVTGGTAPFGVAVR